MSTSDPQFFSIAAQKKISSLEIALEQTRSELMKEQRQNKVLRETIKELRTNIDEILVDYRNCAEELRRDLRREQVRNAGAEAQFKIQRDVALEQLAKHAKHFNASTENPR